MTKALRTDGPTDQPTDKTSYRDADASKNVDSVGRGRERDEEEGGTRMKKGRGGRKGEEEGGTKKVKE